ncbi:MAG: isopenicillin N synthase family oxygenase [Sphingobium sp.]|nr:MAG: isopenicillin N synthase family oxygenase [Sphingobium sp.]
MNNFDHIPMIDYQMISSADPAVRASAAADLRHACENVGFFYLQNHGVPSEDIERCFDAAKRFFALPLEDKLYGYVPRSKQNRGYVAMNEEQVDPNGGKDLHEAFDLSHDVALDDPEVLRGCWLSGPNVWPERAGAEFRQTLEQYYRSMLELSHRLYGAFAMALDLPEAYFDPMLKRPGSFMRILHYPPHPPMTAERADQADQLGIGAHSDYQCFTILAQDEVGGLEVRNAKGDWIAAPPIKGAYVVNIGDMMMRWSNDRFASTQHRVINRSGRERYSIPFFCGIDYDVVIEALPSCIGPDATAKYPPVNAHDYVVGKFMSSFKD